METTISKAEAAIQFKGKTVSLTILHIYSDDLAVIEEQLKKLIIQAPKMFEHAPVAIDLDAAAKNQIKVNLSALIKLMRAYKIIPMAVCGGNADQRQEAITAGLAVLPVTQTRQTAAKANAAASATAATNTAAPSSTTAPTAKAAAASGTTKIINHPIRSGQQIYAKDCDLIILASVSAGAEVIADGNIHVYGTLHGRAIAGANGEVNARIFCAKLDAELVSIAGIYFLSDDYNIKKADTPMQIYLENNRLLIAEL